MPDPHVLLEGWAGVSLAIGAYNGLMIGLGAGAVIGWLGGYAAGAFRMWKG